MNALIFTPLCLAATLAAPPADEAGGEAEAPRPDGAVAPTATLDRTEAGPTDATSSDPPAEASGTTAVTAEPAPPVPPSPTPEPPPAAAPPGGGDGSDSYEYARREPREYLLRDRDRSWSGFGGLRLRPAGVGDDFGFFIGGGGGAVLAERFVIGGAGYGMVVFSGSAGTAGVGDEREELALDMGYGGLRLGWVFAQPRFLDFSVVTLIGGGTAQLNYLERGSRPALDSTGMFVAEPEVIMHLNVARIFRVGFSAGFRFVAHEKWAGPSGFGLMGPSGSVIFDWGWF